MVTAHDIAKRRYRMRLHGDALTRKFRDTGAAMASQATSNFREAPPGTVLETFLVFLRLGLFSFGGPVAHIGIFRDEFVRRRGWLNDQSFADLLAMCQFLPGPASSEFGIAVGTRRAGYLGGLAAWLGFTLPSALLMTGFAIYLVDGNTVSDGGGWLYGLKLAVVAIVANAVIDMARTLCPDITRSLIAAAGAVLAAALTGFTGQFAALVLGGLGGLLLLRGVARTADPGSETARHGNRWVGWVCLAAFAIGLALLPMIAAGNSDGLWALIDRLYRTGALVFGGGHVVLPLLESQFVDPGWLDRDRFMAGYGTAQIVPGPLFSISAYLGASVDHGAGLALGALVATLAIFLPSFLLVWGVSPIWDAVSRHGHARAALAGINAAVVGLLLAALYDPVVTSAIRQGVDVLLAVLGWLALRWGRAPVWLLVPAMAAIGVILKSAE